MGSVEKLTTEKPTPGFYIKTRYIVAIMSFLCLFNVSCSRNNMSIAIVAMVNSTNELQVETNDSSVCPSQGERVTNLKTNGAFQWNTAQQGLILGCYYYGYVCSNIPGAWLATRIGFKLVLGVSMFLSGILTFLLPVTATYSFKLTVALRILMGFLQGVGSPTVQGIWSYWAPLSERTALISIAQSGSSFGTWVVLPLGGLIADSLGWEAVFYIQGGILTLWTLFWFALVYDTPSKHPRISDEEKTYIIESIAHQVKVDEMKTSTPWFSMLTSMPVIAISISHFAANWGDLTMQSLLPTYLSTILKFNITSSGFLSALPYILQWIVVVLVGYATDAVRRKHTFSLTVIRKVNTFIGLVIPAIFVVLAGYVGCNSTAAVAFFCISSMVLAFTVSGSKASTVDIGPQHGGLIYAISNTVASIPGFLAPQITGLLLLDDNSIGQWRKVFWITAGINLFGMVVYLVFGTAKIQDWAKITKPKTKDENETELLEREV